VRRAAAWIPLSLLRSLGGTVAAVLIATQAAAQATPPPGPWVVDVRGVTTPVPTDAGFYPPLATSSVPSRGFGVDVGTHVYFFSMGLARIGVGANYVRVRSTAVTQVAPPVDDEESIAGPGQRLTLTMQMIVPQVSANFGSRDGWSYLSAGVGTASIATETADVMPARQESGRLRSVNVGGGARWFIRPHLAFGFDLRAYRVTAGSVTPATAAFAVSAGLSIR
jgi:hypothetical protein